MSEIEYVTKAEYKEFVRRVEEEHVRMNKRVGGIETTMNQLGDLTLSVKELSVNMKHMIDEIQVQGKKLDVLEGKDGENWRKIANYVLTGIIGIIIAYVAMQMGLK